MHIESEVFMDALKRADVMRSKGKQYGATSSSRFDWRRILIDWRPAPEDAGKIVWATMVSHSNGESVLVQKLLITGVTFDSLSGYNFLTDEEIKSRLNMETDYSLVPVSPENAPMIPTRWREVVPSENAYTRATATYLSSKTFHNSPEDTMRIDDDIFRMATLKKICKSFKNLYPRILTQKKREESALIKCDRKNIYAWVMPLNQEALERAKEAKKIMRTAKTVAGVGKKNN